MIIADRTKYIITVLAFCLGLSAIGQRKATVIGFPVAFHLPETGWGVGLAGACNFYLNKSDTISPASNVQLGLAYTEMHQALSYLPFDLYWKQRKHQLSGELGLDNYNFTFYGIGNDVPKDFSEKYKVHVAKFRVAYLRKLKPHLFVGGRWWYEYFSPYDLKPDGELIKGTIAGSVKSTTSGPGIVALWDNRNSVYNPRSGTYTELSFNVNDTWSGSTYSYTRYRFDLRKYLGVSQKIWLATQLFGDFTNGAVALSQMPSVGTSKRSRGYYDGRFRNNEMLLAQAEIRCQIYKRWGATFFASHAQLADNMSSWNTSQGHWAAGAGLRFLYDQEKKINVRLDAAWTPVGFNYYFTVGEAF